MHPAFKGNRLEGQQSPVVCTHVKRKVCKTLHSVWHHAGPSPCQKQALCYGGLQKSAHIDSMKSDEEGRLQLHAAIIVFAVVEICCFINARARATPWLCPKDPYDISKLLEKGKKCMDVHTAIRQVVLSPVNIRSVADSPSSNRLGSLFYPRSATWDPWGPAKPGRRLHHAWICCSLRNQMFQPLTITFLNGK